MNGETDHETRAQRIRERFDERSQERIDRKEWRREHQ